MQDNPLVSVIVTNFNHARFIDQSILSVISQTYPNIEIIVIDDCSTDDSKKVITNLAETHREINKVIFLPQNRGKWFALNTAISQASGKLIALNDADDVSLPQRIERQVRVMQEKKSFHNLCGFYHCYNQQEIDAAKGTKLEEPLGAVIEHQEAVSLVYKGKNTPGVNHYYLGNFEAHGASCIFYKQHWDFGMRFLPGNMGLRCQKAEDSDFNTKMTLLLQKTSILKEKLYCYRRNTSTNGAWLEEL